MIKAGRHERAEIRIKGRNAIRGAMQALLARWLKEDEKKRGDDQPYNETYYRQHMAWLKTRINEEHLSPRQRHAMFEQLELESRKLIISHKLQAAPIYPPVTLSRMESKRTLLGMHQAQKLRIWNAQFKARLISGAEDAEGPGSLWLGLALWSALSRASLCNPALLDALRHRLCSQEALFVLTIGGQLAIRLEVKMGSALSNGDSGESSPKVTKRANQRVDNIYYHVHYFVPDALTLALIERWLAGGQIVETRRSTLDIIRQSIWSGAKSNARFDTLAGLCRHAAWLADDRPLPLMSEAIGEVVSGRWRTLGLDDASHALLQGNLAPDPTTGRLTAAPFVTTNAQETKTSWAIFDRMQIALAKKGNRYPGSADIEFTLRPIIVMCDPGSVEHLLLNWFLYLLVERRRKPSTIATYHSRISARLIDALDGQSLHSLDEADFELTYRNIIDDIAQPLMREQVAGRLSQLHDFGVRNPSYRLPPIDSIFDDEAGVRFVRSRHIPARALPAIDKAIKANCSGAPILALYAEMAVLLAYRGGLRLGEVVKLRIRDIESSQDKWLFIVDNRFGTNKTSASRRQIPFAALLTESENDAFDAFVRDRADRQRVEEPLFQDPKSGAPLNAMWLSQIVSLALNHVLGGGGWTFHHLRHTAANNLFLAIEEETELGAQFAGWSPKQCQHIREQVLPNSAARQTRYCALAAFMGHADPRQTFESYLHVIEPMLARRRARQPIKNEVALYAAALDAGTQRLAPLKSDGDVAALIVRKLSKFVARTEVDRPSDSRIQKSKLGPRTTTKMLTPADCRRGLQIIEGGGSIGDAAREADIDPATVAQWTENARALASLKTKYGGPRLFHPDRIARANATVSPGGVPIIPLKRELLLPSDPKSLAEWHDCDQLFAHLERLRAIPKLRPELAFATDHVIYKFDCKNSGVAFHRPEDLERFLRVFKGSHIDSARWHLQLRLGDHALAEPWTTQLSKGMTYSDIRSSEKQASLAAHNGIKPAKGHARLHLLHGNWNGAGKGSFTKYTAHTVPYVMHMMAIMRDGCVADTWS